ncbi:MAG: alpha-glucan family phosphorylase [Tepidiformaceae bacterium]
MPLRATRTFVVEPPLPPELEPLRELAWNLRWTWDDDTVGLFRRISRDRWEASGHNPVKLLQETSAAEFSALAADHGFVSQLSHVREAFDHYMSRSPRATIESTGEKEVIAYFSLEFALAECLANYSGGLGVLAGDHLKSASDLGLPLVGVGLLYRQGYFVQSLRPDGWQTEEYHDNDFASLPVRLVLREDRSALTVSVPLDGRTVTAQIWHIACGQANLYLLDTNIDENTPHDRGISSRLYGGDLQMRIHQEIVLGIGGVRALAAVGLRPMVCHMNEGHSALLGLERIRMLMDETGATFAEARAAVAAATIFTTHTAVAAGIDLFPPDLVRRELGPYYSAMGIDDGTMLGLGRTNPGDENEPFSMAVLGLRLSNQRNGVSRLHRGVSQRLWLTAWPDVPVEQIPIGSVTNGVHLATWVAPGIAELYDRFVGRQWRDDPCQPDLWNAARDIPAGDLWRAHEQARAHLVTTARMRNRESSIRRGIGSTGDVLDAKTFTVGFARRFASYKRATLLFRNMDRLARIVNNPERPVQIVFAGRAHPMDEPGKQLIREIADASQHPEFEGKLVFLEEYGISLARDLVAGCDIWLNTPLRPLEASGTSGMKAVANGVIHTSVMDGWWHEAYEEGLGWAVGRNRIDDDPEVQNAFDSEAIYDLLEFEIAPLFYARDHDGTPAGWVDLMKRSIEAFAPVFNTDRMVMEYASEAYRPAAAAWHALTASNLAGAREMVQWEKRVRASWPQVNVVHVGDSTVDGMAEGNSVAVTTVVELGRLSAGDVLVDLAAGPVLPSGEIAIERTVPLHAVEAGGGATTFTGTVDLERSGRAGYAVRVLPNHPMLRDPLSLGLVRWSQPAV